MKQTLIAITLTVAAASAMASTDLSRCEGQYLISALPEAQAQVNPLVLQAIADGVVTLKTYNPKVGPYSVFGLEGNSQKSMEAFNLMQTVQQIPGSILDCNSGLVIN